ncbi:MAG: hypothetical protein HY456_00070 [Parcubacteria group bacterium]|nr:hypothetical protein [Parcubacteria group bacterium]
MGDKAFLFILILILAAVVIYALTASDVSLSAIGSGFSSKTGGGPFAVSFDGGTTFLQPTLHRAAQNGIDVYDIEHSPSDNRVVYAGTNHGILVSNDGGSNWYPYSDPAQEIDDQTVVYRITINPIRQNQIFISAFGNGNGHLYETDNGFLNLTKIAEFKNIAAYAASISGDALYLGLSDGRLFQYSLSDRTFKSLAALGSPIADITANSSDRIYVATKKSGVFAAINGNPNNLVRTDSSDITAFGNGTPGNTVYAASLYGLVRNENNGWIVLDTLIPKKTPVSAVSVTEEDRIYTAAGTLLYESGDQGASWKILYPLQNNQGREISVIDVSANQTIIIGTKN